MTAPLLELGKRIQQELSNLENIKTLALRRWQKALLDEDYRGSVAFDLHWSIGKMMAGLLDDWLRCPEYLAKERLLKN